MDSSIKDKRMQNLKQKKIEWRQGQRLKKPKCPKNRQAVARICTSKNCKNNQGNQIMCGIPTCECSTSYHKQCTNFINYACLTNLINQIQQSMYKQMFQHILNQLSQIIQDAVKNYNNMLRIYDTYLMVDRIKNTVRQVNKEGTISRNNALRVDEFFNEVPQFNIPDLNSFNEFKKGVNDIKQIIGKYKQQSKAFYVNLTKTLQKHENQTNNIVYAKNVQKSQNRKNQFISKNQSRSKSK